MDLQYISIDDAAKRLGVARGTLHYYLRKLKIKTKKFDLDRHAYLAQADFETIRKLKDDAAQRSSATNEAA